jgi:hypothetical protein
MERGTTRHHRMTRKNSTFIDTNGEEETLHWGRGTMLRTSKDDVYRHQKKTRHLRMTGNHRKMVFTDTKETTHTGADRVY